MIRPGPEAIAGVEELLAHALALESESEARYAELADSMEVHNSPETAELFRRLSAYGAAHAEDVSRRATGLSLPAISPWDYKWTCPEGPETACMEDAHYLMSLREALDLALHNESRGRDFYAEVAERSPHPEVRRIATELRDEEEGHVALLRRWLAEAPQGEGRQADDPDPPNMPE